MTKEKICNCGLKESEHNVRHPFVERKEKEITHAKVIATIEALKIMGYNPNLNEGKKHITFQSFGFENFKQEHKKIIRLILEDKFNEFYYASNTQFIYYRY